MLQVGHLKVLRQKGFPLTEFPIYEGNECSGYKA